MAEPDDHTLLRRYAGGDESAFTALFERYVHLVYSAALRQARNPSHAEEITQAVFILLARKAKSLSPKTVLSGWLYQAARLTTASLIKRELRRQRREQELYLQTSTEPVTPLWEQISPLLDDAMGRLGEEDRNAIVLRFFENRTPQEAAAALKLNEVTARKRVSRALEKLRKLFFKRGIASTAETLAGAISAHSVQQAPLAVFKTITAAALAKGALAGAPTLALVKTTLHLMTMKTKTVVTTAVIGTFILGAGVAGMYVFLHHQLGHVTFASKLPMTFANSVFKQDGDQDGFFTVGLDTNMLRTSTSAPAIHINGPIGAQLLTLDHGRSFWNSDNSASTLCVVAPGSPLLGKHISVTGWLKTSNVQKWASAFVLIFTKDFRSKGWSRVDDMSDRPILGTSDWQQVKFVTDVPDQPCVIYFGPDLYGPGELWGDNFQISLADPDAPITDTRAWRQSFTSVLDYPMTIDSANTHDGNPSLCFAYAGPDNSPAKSFAWYGHDIRYPESGRYAGHTVCLSGWVKTENVSDHLQPQIRPVSGLMQKDYKLLAKDSMVQDKSISGTLDWTTFSVTCNIPKVTGSITTSFIFWGGGKVWIDTNSLQLTIVK
ncbi:MAG: sigma-70 family RNA polymerase sigma factor [Verrucomicrobiota bacterium]